MKGPDVFREPERASFQRTRLPNGVRVVTEHIPSVRSISVGIWVFAGSRDERLRQGGISHFVEHMVFKGTTRRRMHNIARRMESVGGYLNAFTGKECTCYYARSLDEHLGRALDTVTDLVLNPAFPERELDKEKDVVLEEMRMYQDVAEDRIFDHFERIVYNDHPLGRPVIGTEASVRGLTQGELQDYVDRQYTPDRMVVAVAGNVDHDRSVRFVQKAFEGWSRPKRRRRRSAPNGYAPGMFVGQAPTQQAHVILGTRGLSIKDEQRVPMVILNTILGGGMSSRLNQNIREKHGFCYNVYSFMNVHSDGGDFGIYLGTDPGRIERAKRLLFRELQKLADKPVGGREFGQAVSQVKGSIMLGLESMTNRMMRLGRQELYLRRYVTLDDMVEQIEDVNADQVQDLAARLLTPNHFSTVVLLPAAVSA